MKNKWFIKISVCLCLTWCSVAYAQEGGLLIDIKAKCAQFTNCCRGIHIDSEGNITCDLECTDGQRCTPAGCCLEGDEVYEDENGVFKCCTGEVEIRNSDNVQVCCHVDKECPEGEIPVKNYVDGVGLCGQVCCGKKENYTTSESSVCDEEGNICSFSSSYSEYVIEGAVNGKCCGGYKEEKRKSSDPSATWLYEDAYKYSIKENEIYYCAKESEENTTFVVSEPDTGPSYSRKGYYVESNMFCIEVRGYFEDDYSMLGCTCSSSGNPGNGEPCD